MLAICLIAMRPLAVKFSVMAVLLAASQFTACYGGVNLCWNPSATPGVTAYNLCWGVSSGVYTFTNTCPGTQTAAAITGLATNQVYFIAVQSVLPGGAVSEFSNEAIFTNGPSSSTSPTNGPPNPSLSSTSTNAPNPGGSTNTTNSGGSGSSSGSGSNLAGASLPATNVWGIPPFLILTMSNGQPSLTLAGTAGASFMIEGTTNLSSLTSWEMVTNVTLTNVIAESQSNQSSQAESLLNMAYAPALQEIPISFSNSGRQQYFRAVMPCDYIILASAVLTNQGYTPRLIVVNMPGIVDDVCYVNETSSFISCSNFIMQVTGSGSTIRQVASVVASSLSQDWTSASQFTYSNGYGQILATVVETEPASSDPIPGQSPPGPPIVINF